MRILTEAEMAEVFGGSDSTHINTLQTVSVTAPRFRSGSFWSGYSDYTTWAEYGSNTGSWYTVGYPAWGPVLPNDNKIQCDTNAAVVIGHGGNPGFTVNKVNAWGWAVTSEPNKGSIFTTPNQNFQAPANVVAINGSNVATGGYDPATGAFTQGVTVLYAGAFKTLTGATSAAYYDDNKIEVPGKALGNLSRVEQYIYTLAHEYQHQYQLMNPAYASLFTNFDPERDATTFAIKALENYRARGPSPMCAGK